MMEHLEHGCNSQNVLDLNKSAAIVWQHKKFVHKEYRESLILRESFWSGSIGTSHSDSEEWGIIGDHDWEDCDDDDEDDGFDAVVILSSNGEGNDVAIKPFKCPTCATDFAKLSTLFQHCVSNDCEQTIRSYPLNKLVKWLKRRHKGKRQEVNVPNARCH
jgi:hypothetical protein